MSSAWRFVFETVDYQLIPAVQEDAAGLSESVELAVQGLMQAARILKAAEEELVPDRDVMWRFWRDLKPERMARAGSESQLAALAELHDQLTIVVLASLLARVNKFTAERRDEDLERASSTAIADRIGALRDEQSIAFSISKMFNNSGSPSQHAEALWDEFSREIIPERQVVMVESLTTAVLRLVCFWMLLKGPIRSYLGDWLRNTQEDEFESLTGQARRIAERSTARVAASDEQLNSAFERLKGQAQRQYASVIVASPLSSDRVNKHQQAFVEGWRSSRSADALVSAAGGLTFDDEPAAETGEQIIERAYFVADTNYIGEEWMGQSLGQHIAQFEERVVLQAWLNAGSEGSGRRPASELLNDLQQFAERFESVAVVLPIAWSASEWTEANHEAIAGIGANVFTTPLLPDDMVLLVAAHGEEWHVASIDAVPRLEIRDVPLDSSDLAAKVAVVYHYARPRQSGNASVLTFESPWERD
jgi:hypothetical protein